MRSSSTARAPIAASLVAASLVGASLVAACGFDWAVVPSRPDAGSGPVAAIQCGKSVCGSDSYCETDVTPAGTELSTRCIAWTCADRVCGCPEIGTCACTTKSGTVIATCTIK